MNTTDTITAALEARRADLEASYDRTVRSTFDRLAERFGKTFDRVYNTHQAPTFKNLVEPNLAARKTDRVGEIRELDDARIARNASAYATFVIQAWGEKIAQKMGEVESAVVSSLDTWSFKIVGQVNGHTVRIEQRMIVNFSTKGTPFNQFPARVYVDGKATTAAAWKALSQVAA
ncbi:hypothetical protein [Tabrizicola soli]|uniref:Uncharacterized protein n=1 Tax=Tabrizicola soli TaxID=2185115 RepID=A0ABV7E1M0_9RHOB|nr:hypothetical protein [Tabrizicola soli]